MGITVERRKVEVTTNGHGNGQGHGYGILKPESTEAIKRAFAELDHRIAAALEGGGEERVRKLHEQGKMTARERIELFADPGSFVEADMFVQHQATQFGLADKKFLGDGVVTGTATVEGRPVAVYAQDFTVLGGSLGEAHAKKIVKLQETALKNGVPLVGLNDSGGARIQEGVAALAGYGDIFYNNVMASGVIPQVTAILGPCAGGAVYSPALTDFILMAQGTGHMFVTGPDVVKTVTGQQTTFEDLGGAAVHATKSGVVSLVGRDEEETLHLLRRLLGFLPLNNLEDAPHKQPTDSGERRDADLDTLVPADARKPYDMRDVIKRVVDDREYFELQEAFAPNLTIGFARLNGGVVGVVGNNPNCLAGAIDINASVKGARFVRFCDAFNIPLVTFVDVPGFLPGLEQEHGGIIRNGAKLLYAYCEATVPKLTVVTRKAYGGAYIVMCSKHLRSDVNLAWPTTEIAVMGPDAAVNVVFKREIDSAADPAAKRRELEDAYRKAFATPFAAAERGWLDDVIKPRDTRVRLIRSLELLRRKRATLPAKKHGSIPL